jgi:uridine phosphorylase
MFPELPLPELAAKNVREYVRRAGGKNVDLAALKPLERLAGVVLHDDVTPLQNVLPELAKRYIIPGEGKPTDPSKRFRSWKVQRGDQHVLLLETSMGSANSSVVIHELSAGLGDLKTRILKIGTCGGVLDQQPTGTVFVPRWALEDEGATKWNKTVEPMLWPHSTVFHQPIYSADCELTSSWWEYLISPRIAEGLNHASDGGLEWTRDFLGESLQSAIWTIDAFHAYMWHPERFGPVVSDPYVRSGVVLFGMDMECSSLYSACEGVALPIAAALVVTWNREHKLNLARTGDPNRQPREKDRAHAVEEQLVKAAVNYLFRE